MTTNDKATQSFLLKMFFNLGTSNPYTDKDLHPELIAPADVDWKKREQERDPSKACHYTLNPELRDFDFSKAKIKIEILSADMRSKRLFEVATYVNDTYGREYHIPGIEYWAYLCVNPLKVPARLNTGKVNFFFGSILCSWQGTWYVPRAGWNGKTFYPTGDWLHGLWVGGQVVLIKKE